MKIPNDGGPAFPVPEMHYGTDTKQRCDNQGMTLRDWFAGMALQGYLAGRNNCADENPMNFERARAASDCYRYADAMISELEKERQAS